MSSVAQIAKKYGLKVHLDGARLANASVALGVPMKELTRGADSTMICLSKGLCAPIGSVLCGSRSFIAEARRNRKQVGGGMRQVGVIAAAWLVALKEMVKRLDEDHANAKRLAEGMRSIPGIVLQNPEPWTNMVYFQLGSGAKVSKQRLLEHLRNKGILADMRLVTHRWITSRDIESVLGALRDILRG